MRRATSLLPRRGYKNFRTDAPACQRSPVNRTPLVGRCIFQQFDGMAPAHDARTQPPQSLPAPANCAGEGRRTERHAYQTKPPTGHEQAVSLRQDLIYSTYVFDLLAPDFIDGRWAGPRPRSRGRGHMGRERISCRVCAGLGRDERLAGRPLWHPNHPANLRSATRTRTYRTPLRRSRDTTHPRVCLAMVSGWRPLVSENCAPAVEFQSPQLNTRARRVSGSPLRGHCS